MASTDDLWLWKHWLSAADRIFGLPEHTSALIHLILYSAFSIYLFVTTSTLASRRKHYPIDAMPMGLTILNVFLLWLIGTVSFVQNVAHTHLSCWVMVWTNDFVVLFWLFLCWHARAMHIYFEYTWQTLMVDVSSSIRRFPRQARRVAYELDLLGALLDRSGNSAVRWYFFRKRGVMYASLATLLLLLASAALVAAQGGEWTIPARLLFRFRQHHDMCPYLLENIQPYPILLILAFVLIPLQVYALRGVKDAHGIRNRLFASEALGVIGVMIIFCGQQWRRWSQLQAYFPPPWIALLAWLIGHTVEVAWPTAWTMIEPSMVVVEQAKHASRPAVHRRFLLCGLLQVGETECQQPCCQQRHAARAPVDIESVVVFHPWMLNTPPLADILDDAPMSELFEAFCIRHFSRQYLLFYRAVRVLHAEMAAWRQAQAASRYLLLVDRIEALFDQYICATAPCQLHLSPATRAAILRQLRSDDLNESIFDDAQRAVLVVMERKTYPWFVKETRREAFDDYWRRKREVKARTMSLSPPDSSSYSHRPSIV